MKHIIYLCIIFAILVTPFVGMAFAKDTGTMDAEKRTLASLPCIVEEDGTFNSNYMQELGTYFEDHFAFRSSLVTVHGLVKQRALGTSPGDEVVLGKDGWLFYEGTLDDYFRRDPLTERELYIIAHNMRMIQDYCEAQGANFIFVIPANKNSIYPEYMPGNYVEGTEASNLMALLPYLDDAHVRYANMQDVFEGKDEILYYKTDSHWTDKGAALGFAYIMDKLGLAHPDFVHAPYTEKADQKGDLAEMLLPAQETLEACPRIVYDWQSNAPLSEEEREEGRIETVNPRASGSLVMFRDSFGTALVPYFAESFGNAYFSRAFPYRLHDVIQQEATTVIVEKVERNLIDLAIVPAIMPPQPLDIHARKSQNIGASIEVREEDSLVQIHASVPENFIQQDTNFYISVDGTTYEAFLSTNSEREGNDGYIYIGRSQLEHKEVQLQLMISDANGVSVVATQSCKITGGDSSSDN